MLVRGGVSTHVLLHHGREYDAAAIAGIAHGLATGRTLTPADIPGGGAGRESTSARLASTSATTPPDRAGAGHPLVHAAYALDVDPQHRHAASHPRRRDHKPVNLCPCFIALPATGVCDTCD